MVEGAPRPRPPPHARHSPPPASACGGRHLPRTFGAGEDQVTKAPMGGGSNGPVAVNGPLRKPGLP